MHRLELDFKIRYAGRRTTPVQFDVVELGIGESHAFVHEDSQLSERLRNFFNSRNWPIVQIQDRHEDNRFAADALHVSSEMLEDFRLNNSIYGLSVAELSDIEWLKFRLAHVVGRHKASEVYFSLMSHGLNVIEVYELASVLKSAQIQHGFTLIVETDDVRFVSAVSESLSVFFSGRIVESALVGEWLDSAAHPFAHLLQRATPSPLPETELLRMSPRVPSHAEVPEGGCAFYSRCPQRNQECGVAPSLRAISADHYVSCHFPVLASYWQGSNDVNLPSADITLGRTMTAVIQDDSPAASATDFVTD